MPSTVAAILAELASVLEALHLRWYLFGAQAAIHYGSARLTADVDVTVELGALAPEALIARLRDVGIEPRINFDDSFIATARVLPMLHRDSGMGVDVVFAGLGPEQTFLRRARLVRFDGVTIRIAAPDDIVVMKVLAGRAKDVEDVVGILRAAPEGLDENAVRATLAELEAMLGQSDLLPLFDAAVERARKS